MDVQNTVRPNGCTPRWWHVRLVHVQRSWDINSGGSPPLDIHHHCCTCNLHFPSTSIRLIRLCPLAVFGALQISTLNKQSRRGQQLYVDVLCLVCFQDVEETDNAFQIFAGAPGMSPEEVTVEVSDDGVSAFEH